MVICLVENTKKNDTIVMYVLKKERICHMGKKIAKIIFIFIGVVFTFLAYVIAYNSGASTNYFDLVNEASKSESHSDMCKAFSMYQIPYDATPIAETNKGAKNEIVVYNAINQLNLTYYETTETSSNSVNYAKIQYMYYFFIYSPQFDYGAIEGKNETGLRFYGENGETYTFHYVVDNNANKDEIVETPKSPKEALFNTSRNMVTTYSDYGFVFTSISELFVEGIREKLNSPITKLELLNNKSNVVEGTTIEVKFDFSQQFFTDMAEFKQASVDLFEIEQISSGERTAEEKTKYDEAQNYINSFNIDNYKDKGYDKGFSKDDIYTTKLIFSSIGIAALFALVIVIVFILVFYFKRIKNWVFGGRHSRTTQRIVPNKMPTKQPQPAKTNFDRVNEKRAEDLAKKKAQDEEIKKRGNMIIAPTTTVEEAKEEANEESKVELTKDDIKLDDEALVVENNEATAEVEETKTEL